MFSTVLQQRLNFFDEPQGQGAFLPGPLIETTRRSPFTKVTVLFRGQPLLVTLLVLLGMSSPRWKDTRMSLICQKQNQNASSRISFRIALHLEQTGSLGQQ